jgi:hypothetical protein
MRRNSHFSLIGYLFVRNGFSTQEQVTAPPGWECRPAFRFFERAAR